MKKLTRFLAGAWLELKRVKWPTFSQAVRYTLAIIIFVAFISAFSFLVSWIMSIIIEVVGG